VQAQEVDEGKRRAERIRDRAAVGEGEGGAELPLNLGDEHGRGRERSAVEGGQADEMGGIVSVGRPDGDGFGKC
jgi:hypothetical protein